MEHLNESNQVSVAGAYDVIVVGGGIAGVSAALAARRSGCSVLLIEKSVVLGGSRPLVSSPSICLSATDGAGR